MIKCFTYFDDKMVWKKNSPLSGGIWSEVVDVVYEAEDEHREHHSECSNEQSLEKVFH